MSIPYLNNLDSGQQARDIINDILDPVNSINGSVAGTGFGDTQFTGSFTGSLNGIAATASFTPNAVVTGSVVTNVITLTRGNGSSFTLTVDTGSIVNTGSLLVTASISTNTITFTKGDGSTFPITVDTGSIVNTGSLLVTASISTNTITFTKGDGSTFPITVDTGSIIDTGSLLVTASVSSNVVTFIKGDGSSFPITIDTGSGGGSPTSPGGSDTQIQFNSGSTFAGTASFTFNYNSQSLQQGNNTTASGLYSHAEGDTTQAVGDYSHAEGTTTKTGTQNAYYAESVVSGVVTLSGSYGDITSQFVIDSRLYLYDRPFDDNYNRRVEIISQSSWNGTNTIVELYETSITTTTAYVGDIDYGISNWTGDQTIPGNYAHAEGSSTFAIGEYSHAEGSQTQAIGDESHAEGSETKAIGQYSHAEGTQTQAIGPNSHAEGDTTQAIGPNSHAEGDTTQAIGVASHAEGEITQAIGAASHAEGHQTTASGSYSHAEGASNVASGDYSHAEGSSSLASGDYSHAEGRQTTASGSYSHAEGFSAIALGAYSHAEGRSTLASGSLSHAEGNGTLAIGQSSHVEGLGTVASGDYQHVQGKYNISSSAEAAFIIGNGASGGARSNLVFASGSSFQITGSLISSGSINFPALVNKSQINAIVVDTASGQLYYLPTSSFGVGGGGGDITGVTAGSGLSGGGSSGEVTIALNTGSSHFIDGVSQLTGSLLLTSSFNNWTGSVSSQFAGTSSFATTASYVNLVAGPRIQAINYAGQVISITGSIGGSDQAIQFNSGSAFSGSNNFRFNYTNNQASLTGSLLVTGSQVITGSFDAHLNENIYWNPSFRNVNSGTSAATELQLLVGSGSNGTKLNLQIYPSASSVNSYLAGGSVLLTAPVNNTGSLSRPVKAVSAIVGSIATTNSFEWHYNSAYQIGSTTLKMKLDVPSGALSNSGSIVTSGSLTIASGSSSTNGDGALYFGSSGSVGSWRIAPSGANLVIQKWDGTSYSGGTTITP